MTENKTNNIYVDPKDMPKPSFTISTTPCPKCGFKDDIDIGKPYTSNINKNVKWEEEKPIGKTYWSEPEEILTCKPIGFSSPFKALAWCYRNPMKMIKYEWLGDRCLLRYNNIKKEMEDRYIEEKEFDKLRGNISDLYMWKNIKEYKEETKEEKIYQILPEDIRETKIIEENGKMKVFINGLLVAQTQEPKEKE